MNQEQAAFDKEVELLKKEEHPGCFVDDVTKRIERCDEDGIFASDEAAALSLAAQGYTIEVRPVEGVATPGSWNEYYLVTPSEEGLLPCPFCGHDEVIIEDEGSGEVCCGKCQGYTWGNSKEEAVRCWNSRAPQSLEKPTAVGQEPPDFIAYRVLSVDFERMRRERDEAVEERDEARATRLVRLHDVERRAESAEEAITAIYAKLNLARNSAYSDKTALLGDIERLQDVEKSWSQACKLASVHCPVSWGESHVHDGIPRLAARCEQLEREWVAARAALLRLHDAESRAEKAARECDEVTVRLREVYEALDFVGDDGPDLDAYVDGHCDAKAVMRINSLRAERDEWKERAELAERERDEARAELARLVEASRLDEDMAVAATAELCAITARAEKAEAECDELRRKEERYREPGILSEDERRIHATTLEEIGRYLGLKNPTLRQVLSEIVELAKRAENHERDEARADCAELSHQLRRIREGRDIESDHILPSELRAQREIDNLRDELAKVTSDLDELKQRHIELNTRYEQQRDGTQAAHELKNAAEAIRGVLHGVEAQILNLTWQPYKPEQETK